MHFFYHFCWTLFFFKSQSFHQQQHVCLHSFQKKTNKRERSVKLWMARFSQAAKLRFPAAIERHLPREGRTINPSSGQIWSSHRAWSAKNHAPRFSDLWHAMVLFINISAKYNHKVSLNFSRYLRSIFLPLIFIAESLFPPKNFVWISLKLKFSGFLKIHDQHERIDKRREST